MTNCVFTSSFILTFSIHFYHFYCWKNDEFGTIVWLGGMETKIKPLKREREQFDNEINYLLFF